MEICEGSEAPDDEDEDEDEDAGGVVRGVGAILPFRFIGCRTRAFLKAAEERCNSTEDDVDKGVA